MTAETKPPFDPEAEARRLTVVCCEHTIPLRPTQNRCIHCITAALSRAFEAGAAAMRERAFQTVTEIRWASAEAEVRPSRESALYDAAMRVRALPLSETR